MICRTKPFLTLWQVDAEKLFSYALEHWENVKPFNDPNSLQQHIAAVKTSFNLSNSVTPAHRDTNRDPGASEMVAESIDSKDLNPLIDHPRILTSGVDTLVCRDRFGTDDSGYMFDSTLRPDQYSDMDLGWILDDSDIGSVVYGNGVWQQDFIDGMNNVTSINETGIMLAESEVIPNSTVWRKYRTLFRCLSKWLLIRKMSKFEENPAWKRQRLC